MHWDNAQIVIVHTAGIFRRSPQSPRFSRQNHAWVQDVVCTFPHVISGADLEGGGAQLACASSILFAEMGCLILCGCPRQKECTKSCELTLKITIFLHFWGGTSLQTPLSATCTEVLSVLNLGAPSFKKSWIRPWIWCHKKGVHSPLWGK